MLLYFLNLFRQRYNYSVLIVVKFLHTLLELQNSTVVLSDVVILEKPKYTRSRRRHYFLSLLNEVTSLF